jgi:transposase-like protein
MRKIKIDENRKCPKCGIAENQINRGFTSVGSQRCLCKTCNCVYTLNPKPHAYPDEVKQQALHSYYHGVGGSDKRISGRAIGEAFGMSKTNVYNWVRERRNKMKTPSN